MQDSKIFYEAAKMYRKEGLNAIPCTDQKRPVGTWTEYQNKYIPEEEFTKRLNGHAYGIGILTGIGSGNMEVIDIDTKYDLTNTLSHNYFKFISDHDQELFDKLRIVQSPSYGFHLYYRCDTIEGSQKLACRPTTPEERQLKPDEKSKVLIETRGLGAFVVAPPTEGYRVWQENEIPKITVEQRSFLLDTARSFNELYEVVQPKAIKEFDSQKSPYDLSPWDDYNRRGDIIKLLEKHGWEVDAKYKSEDRTYLIRPGKSQGQGYSADYLKSDGLFKCWSTSDANFATEKAYNHTAVFAILECKGDFSEATKKLEEMGYGKRKAKIEKPKQDQPTGNQPSQVVPTKTLEDFDYLLVTTEKEIPKEEPVITICGASFAAAHNISLISAAPKGAKTSINNVMVSCSISEDGTADGFPDIKARVNEDHKAVILFDTEQSQADQQYNVRTIVKRAGIENTPDFLRCYNIRQLESKAYKEATEVICTALSDRFGGIHSIFIDGGADYIASVNDEEQSTEIIQWFTHLSIRHNCPVIIVVHQNPGGEKERGHFGSTGQRKCYGLISIEKQDDLFTLKPKMLRRAGNAEMQSIQFSYSQAKGYHIQVDAPDKELERAIKERERLCDIAGKVFPPGSSFCHKDAIARIMDSTHKGASTAKTMLNNMVGFQYIEKGEDRNYRVNMEKVKKVKTGQNVNG